MNPSLFQLLADEHIRQQLDARNRTVRRTRRPGVVSRLATRTRVGVGGLLVTLGTRLAGPRTGPVGLHRPPT